MVNINALLSIIHTGDFLGYAVTGIEEDHPLVGLMLALHTLFI